MAAKLLKSFVQTCFDIAINAFKIRLQVFEMLDSILNTASAKDKMTILSLISLFNLKLKIPVNYMERELDKDLYDRLSNYFSSCEIACRDFQDHVDKIKEEHLFLLQTIVSQKSKI